MRRPSAAAEEPSPATEEPGGAARFHDLVVKCLIKLTKALGGTMHLVDLPALLAAIHAFFHDLGDQEIRRRVRLAQHCLPRHSTHLQNPVS